MKTYKFQVIADGGVRTVTCKTSAKTESGICRVMGKAVADTIHTDVFVCKPKALWMDGVAKNHPLGAWHTWSISKSAEHYIWKAAQDAIMDGMLA